MILHEKIRRAIAAIHSGNKAASTPEQNWLRFQSWLEGLRTDRVKLSPALSAFVTEMVARYPDGSDPRPAFYLTPYVEKHGILPLFLHWTEAVGLMPDGTVRMFWTGDGPPGDPGYEGLRKLDEGQRKVDAGWNFLLALIEGARAYPALQAVVPARPDYMRTCPVCLGSGRLPEEPVQLCNCHGFGWALCE
jgi:hypothetical protein